MYVCVLLHKDIWGCVCEVRLSVCVDESEGVCRCECGRVGGVYIDNQ